VTGTTRALGLLSLLTLGLNGIVGVGIFFAPREVAALVPGGAGIAVYAATALALLPIAAAYAILGGRFDEDGGPYVWARAAFGPAVGFGVGWIAYASALFSTAAVVAGLSEHAAALVGLGPGLETRGLGLGCVLVLGSLAAAGLRPSALAWSALTALKLLPLVLVALALAWLRPSIPQTPAPPGASEFARAALVVVFALQGFEIVPVPAGHARRAAHAVPVATLGSVMLAALLYLALHAACVAALPDLANTRAPLATAAGVLGGPALGTAVAFGTNISALGIAFGMFAMTPRYLAALGRRDGLGPALSREDGRGVPQAALWTTSAAVAILVAGGGLMELFALSSVAVLAQYAVSAAALAVLALRRVRGLGPRHLWPVPFALGAIVLIGQAAQWRELVVAAVVLGVGIALLVTRRSRALQP
jgi:basic amino acid/polyamine antiporter, APA family